VREASASNSEAGPGAAAVAPVRRGVAHAVIAILIAGQMAAILSASELYPFSPYPMFSQSYAGKREFEQLALVGVTATGEVALDRKWLRGATSTRIKHLRKFFERAERLNPAQIPGRLSELLSAYSEYRERGRRELPELIGLRLYREAYTLANHATNRGKPERRALIAEVTAAPAQRGSDAPQ
jgi:hypothetical protein